MDIPAITTWMKICPDPYGDDYSPSLEGRVYDPAWMLGRQWQVGEFVGEDAGSPIDVSVTVTGRTLTEFQAGPGGAVPLGSLPVNFLAGCELPHKRVLIESAEAGAELVNVMKEYGCPGEDIDTLAQNFPLLVDNAIAAENSAAKYFDLLSPKPGTGIGLPDPFNVSAGGQTLGQLLENSAKTGVPDSRLGIGDKNASAFVSAAREWMKWMEMMYPQSPAFYSWRDEYLEHSFKMNARDTAGGGTAFICEDWDGAELDWYSMDVEGETTKSPVTAPRRLAGFSGALEASFKGMPTELTYAGMPAARWWEFEDSKVNYLQVSADENDLARLLVVEFAIANGNDWYMIPMELPVGALYTIKEFKVLNTFGDVKTVPPVSDGKNLDWSVFRQSYADKREELYDGLLLFPTVYTGESPPFEQVHFFRDEMTNVAWARESTIEGADGRPYDREVHFMRRKYEMEEEEKERERTKESVEEKPQDTSKEKPEEGHKDVYEYELVSLIPDHWFPLMPATGYKYQMLQMKEDIKPLGSILKEKTPVPAGQNKWLSFWQNEIPREGSEVLRRHIMTRDGEGKVMLWRGRQKRAGHGEGSSGLQYDSFK